MSTPQDPLLSKLQSISLEKAPQAPERLMYDCGFAAGQVFQRRRLRRQGIAMAVAALLSGVLAGGTGTLLFPSREATQVATETAADQPTDSETTITSPSTSVAEVNPRQAKQDNRSNILSVGISQPQDFLQVESTYTTSGTTARLPVQERLSVGNYDWFVQ